MTVEEANSYGDGLSLIQKLRLLSEWAPLLSRAQSIVTADTPHDQAVAVVGALQWAAGKTSSEIDDEALEHVEAVLKTPEGRAFFEWAIDKISGGKA